MMSHRLGETPNPVERIDSAIDVVARAFAADPTWSPVLGSRSGDLARTPEYWALFVRSAQRYPWSFETGGGEAVSVWFPPGGSELTDEEEAGFAAFARGLIGAERTDRLLEVIDRFEAATPEEPHFYLSLLATDPQHRGHGHGMRLLAENLRELDRRGEPSYLESSNPANDERYLRLGYQRHGSIELPSGLTLTTMWRDPHPGENAA